VTKRSLDNGTNRGLLITFEGPEGSGKTTLIGKVCDYLAQKGCESLVIREPGGTPIGERIRNILLDPASSGMRAETELLLMVASRAQLVRERIEPALEAGLIILCDRFADASVAYQGCGRRLGAKVVEVCNEVALSGLVHDLTFLCMLPPEAGRARLKRRKTDRLDHEAMEFHKRVYDGYQAMASSGDQRYCIIDANRSPEQMFNDTLARLKRLEHGLLKYI